MSQQLKTGDKFEDRYEILGLLGSGGFGCVYKAMQLDCSRLVAIKILHEHAAADLEYRARFLREAQTLSQLSHSNIVMVYHLGLSTNDTPYLAMEYLGGRSIRDVLNEKDRLPVLTALRIVHDAARALHYTHERGIIHRDLKPENMILVSEPEPDTLKLVDFGLAGISNSETMSQKITSTGAIIGSSAYMSPEQCLLKLVDFRTDIYSLSACLYEMIVGQKTVVADTAIGMMYKQINAPVPQIRTDQVQLFDPVLNEILASGMAKSPEARFSSMNEMADAIDAAIVLLQTKSPANPFKKWILAGAACLAVVMLATAAIKSLSFNHTKRAEASFVVESEQDKTEQAIAKLKKQLSRWPNPEKIEDPSVRERYLHTLFALGREQVNSENMQDIGDAVNTYSTARDFCKGQSSQLKNLQPAFTALRAKAECALKEYQKSEEDFDEALRFVETTSHDNEMKMDILCEKTLLDAHLKKWSAALADFEGATIGFNKNIMIMEPVLDKDGDNRSVMYRNVLRKLNMIEPETEEDTVGLVKLSSEIVSKLLVVAASKELEPYMDHCELLIHKYKGHEDLKDRMVQVRNGR